jgi:hypothetical protein
MVIENVTQVPYNTSLIGMIHGAAKSYGMDISAPELFGGTGHAFLANVHEQLCPSGPYVWDPARFFTLCRNMGLDITDLGFFSASSSMDERGEIEADIRDVLTRGVICGVLNMEYQNIYGYDDNALLLAEPWGAMPMTPPKLSFGSWSEFGEEMHINFFKIEKVDAEDFHTIAKAALEFAVEIAKHPHRYTQDHYGMGPEAYVNWLSAIESGHGAEHGAWWNAVVWGECRHKASEFLALVGERFSDVTVPAMLASELYKSIGNDLSAASDKEMQKDEKRKFVERARDSEAEALSIVSSLVEAL